MNKDTAYVAILAVLCVLAGVFVGATIAKKAALPWSCPEKSNFTERAERMMGHGYKGWGDSRHGEGLFGRISGRLDLNKDQQVKVKDILEKTRQEIDEVGKNIRSSITKIKENADSRIMELLNPEQQEKFKALLEEKKNHHKMREHWEGRGSMMERGSRSDEDRGPAGEAVKRPDEDKEHMNADGTRQSEGVPTQK